MTSRPSVVFFGTPALGVPTLHALVEEGFAVPLVVTAPPRRRGRGSAVTPTPIAEAASELGLQVGHDPDAAAAVGADLGVVVAFGRLLRPDVLHALPCVNLHVSLLPRWRGAAPVERAILAGDTETGVCVMEVTEGLDEGGVYASARTTVGDKTVSELWSELIDVGTDLLVQRLRAWSPESGLGTPEPQQGEVTYAHKLTAEDRHIDWSAPAEQILRVVRIGGAWTTFRGVRCKIPAARRTESGAAEPTVVHPEGKRPVPFEDWRRGVHLEQGEWFE